jgi:acetylornithine deacetylase/succinyl-diaminopimelate desuccinylase-like protein
MPKGHGGAHAPDEKIWIPGFFDAMRLLVQYIMATDDYLNR